MSIQDIGAHTQLNSTTCGTKRFMGLLRSRSLAQKVAELNDAGVKTSLEIYGTHTLTASLDIKENVTVIMKPGSKITLNAGVDLGINGVCLCEGADHFSISSTSWLIFGRYFQAGGQVFSGAGLDHVRFGLGPELMPDPTLATTALWTSTGWTFNTPGFTHNTGNTTGLSLVTGPTISAIGQYWSVIKIATWTAGTLTINLGGGSSPNLSHAAYWEALFKTGTTAAPYLVPGSTCDAKITYFSTRQVIGSRNNEIYPEWWGANNTDDCSPAINAALQAAKGSILTQTSSGYGRTVKLSAYRYNCNSPIYHPIGARCFGEGIGTVVSPTTSYATGTVPNYASLKFDASIAEYDTGFWFLDNIGGALWLQDVLGDFHINGAICPGGDLAGQGTKDFTMLYVLRNATYVGIRKMNITVNTARRQSHFLAGSEGVTERWSADAYDRSGLQINGMVLSGQSKAINRFAYHFAGAGDAQLSTHMNIMGDSKNTVAIMDGEARIENIYIPPSSSNPKWCDECLVGSVAGNQLSVTITGRNVADNARFIAGATIYYQRPNNVWGTIALHAVTPATYSGGNTTVYFQTTIPTDVTAIYSTDGGTDFVIANGGFGNMLIAPYFDSQVDVNMPILNYSYSGTYNDLKIPLICIQNHNIYYKSQFANVCAVAGQIFDAAAEIAGRPDQMKLNASHGNVTAYFVQNKYIYVFHAVDGWRKGQVVSSSFDGTNTLVTTKQPIFRTIASGAQKLYRELEAPYWSLGKWGLLS